ncbi:class I SAM-dependent methyltransferase [Peribacillus tepidiphilus]|uniref:class I SAM-dependent methyltransferase n=1 Tax=Peribacillus tepidiphilus TaxID=2652445 RepID=UPI0035B54794
MIVRRRQVKYTGERVIPDEMKPTNGMLLEHLARYHFSSLFLKGRVLDLACGSGYGTQLITKLGKDKIDEVVGVDISKVSIEYARGRYFHPKINYIVGNAEDPNLPNQLGQFDSIVSFETLEHLHNEKQFLHNLFALLKEGGTLVLSTPFGRGRGKPTNEPFHVHQLTEEEFKGLFHSYSQVDFYYQKGVLIEPMPGRTGIHYSFGIAVCTK